ncbi:MAG: MarR family transcriptional regulator [Rhodospirillales bacterium]|nr:MAG: MarR family transcriptional regulator [Rhodospirillales bacterium]
MRDSYLSVVRLIERLHRHFLDVLRIELRRLGIDDINAVQALLLSNIGDEEVVIRDLKDRGYYHGSNVSYNIKKLTECAYLAQERSSKDRRSVILRLTDKGMALCTAIRNLQTEMAGKLGERPDSQAEFVEAGKALLRLERTWTDFIRYGD